MAVQTKEITIAHSPDSDDAFMFYALANDKLDTKGLVVHQVLKDIQSLNQDAINGRYEVSAISFAAYPFVKDKYMLMPCGASMGDNYGPMVIAKPGVTKENLKDKTIAIPGKLTTAYLTLQLWMPGLKVVEVPFNEIIDYVVAGKADAGLIIHEGQLMFQESGLELIVDLGVWWHDETGLPLPLGGNVVRKDLGEKTVKDATELFKTAVVYALDHRQEALDYAMTFARDMKRSLADKFVGMYVNDLTVDYGERGRKAVAKLFEMAYAKGLTTELIVPEFVD
ncbi:MAG: ABC transporter substrate-binding protein [Candidatus Obscuribacter sp.]|nr:ABC transporter substrate-binding protein [Candidatus Obscuribacter sp.]MDQ5964295.1 1,4-dihydroxy-6-naphtoate synthase [Cyanobacteriota bacterium erpe_2018_sw_39hr_WHONDRS-SW48-000098_B_bin.30]MBK7841448.1 ABC transporter substrate-binding protein [Candidatus Obscuribacter sp.]MBK9618738.1 ABC transporter substrate-binding protein [Candidatus Obscuribacter sp.]MBK9769857.1 ABC transporter substrate-binding protein [Candidatus Obscuribacter sp.]